MATFAEMFGTIIIEQIRSFGPEDLAFFLRAAGVKFSTETIDIPLKFTELAKDKPLVDTSSMASDLRKVSIKSSKPETKVQWLAEDDDEDEDVDIDADEDEEDSLNLDDMLNDEDSDDDDRTAEPRNAKSSNGHKKPGRKPKSASYESQDVIKALRVIGSNATMTEIVEATGMDLPIVRKFMHELMSDNKVVKHGAGRGTTYQYIQN